MISAALIFRFCFLHLIQALIIAGPEAGTTLDAAATETASTNGGSIGDCITDTFSVSVPGGVSSPVICGVNTGQHSKCSTTKYEFSYDH